MQMDTEDITILEMVEDHGIACELESRQQGRCDNQAEWVMFRSNCPGCGSRPPALACTVCKDARIQSEDGVYCMGCDEVFIPARLGYSRIEPL